MKKLFLFFVPVLVCGLGIQAAVSEPDNVVYGTITFGTTPVTAANTDVVIEARNQLNGPAIASYRMGDQLAAGNFYSLRIGLESFLPVADPSALVSGQSVYLVVYDSTGVRAQASYKVGARGQMTRMDLAGALAGQTSHPADINPADNSISISEVVAYSSAWRNGTVWSVGPTNIPVSYAVRAGALWRGGASYRLDSSVGSAPAWWVSFVATIVNPGTGSNLALGLMPIGTVPGTPFNVTNRITPATNVTVYAVEDQPPAGWLVSNISDGGTWDPVNRKVKWGLFFDNAPRALTYTVTPPVGASGSAAFSGQASFDGIVTMNIGGVRTVALSSVGQMTLRANQSGNGINLALAGSPGQKMVVETSTNLISWSTLSNVVISPSGLLNFSDPIGTNHQQFYRTRSLP